MVSITSRHDLSRRLLANTSRDAGAATCPGCACRTTLVRNRRNARSVRPRYVHDPEIPQSHGHQAISSRSRRGRRGDRPRSCGRPRPAPRRRSCAGTLLPARLGEVLLGAGDGAMRCLPPIYPLRLKPSAKMQAIPDCCRLTRPFAGSITRRPGNDSVRPAYHPAGAGEMVPRGQGAGGGPGPAPVRCPLPAAHRPRSPAGRCQPVHPGNTPPAAAGAAASRPLITALGCEPGRAVPQCHYLLGEVPPRYSLMPD